MKIIHTADLHLDSKLSRYFDSAKASQRRNELLLSFQKMVEYGSTVGVSAIIIAGDLFDVRKISATARDAVYSSVVNNPDIEFFYLRGNHDADTFLNQITEKYGSLPENLKMFSGDWTSYVHTEGDVSVVITGADRIALNGDSANKIGTYMVAIAAKYHNVPFYIAAPKSTIDPNIKSGDEIVIELRNREEVTTINDKLICTDKVNIINPGFDVTPNSLITGIITEYGVYKPNEIYKLFEQI